MAPFRWISAVLAKIETALVSLSLLTMITLAFLQVVLRNAFDMGISWGDPVVRALVLWVGFLGASLATQQKGHIRFDVISKFLPPRVHQFTEFFVSLVSAFICILLTQASYGFMEMEREFGSMLVGEIPTWVGLIIIPISFIIMAFRFVLQALLSFQKQSLQKQPLQVSGEER